MNRDNSFDRRWLDLSSLVDRGEWDRLSDADRVFYATNRLRGYVMRGGFHSYFDQTPTHQVRLATAAFRQHGVPEIADLVDRAEAILFPNDEGANSAGSREVRSWSDEEIAADVVPAWEAELDAVNRSFYSAAKKVDAIVERLARDGSVLPE